jgi:hydroxyethylthiazole kinase-like uncharacterized protein yjeF
LPFALHCGVSDSRSGIRGPVVGIPGAQPIATATRETLLEKPVVILIDRGFVQGEQEWRGNCRSNPQSAIYPSISSETIVRFIYAVHEGGLPLTLEDRHMDSEPLYFSATLRKVEAAHAEDGLMARAGAAAAAWAGELREDRTNPVLVLAGPGNNGGDAFETARLLRRRGIAVTLVFPGNVARLPRDAAEACRQYAATGGAWETTLPENPPGASSWSLVVDGLFGIGFTRALEGEYARLVERANALSRAESCPLLALDCPSGLDVETGATSGDAVIRATHTLTFLGAKPGLYTANGPDHCGIVRIADLGLDLPLEAVPDGYLVTPSEFTAHLGPRARNSHKGCFGAAGLLGGAPGMAGALLLAGRAALKLGAGRVFLGFLDAAAPAVDPCQPELMMRAPDTLLKTGLDVLACGPGMGQDRAAATLLKKALRLEIPLVLDADALNLLAGDAALATLLQARRAPTLLTPHPAEAARLLRTSVAEIQRNRIGKALELATHTRAWVILKGCGSIIAAPDGQWRINPFGNPGLATAGSGDVLTGIVTALLAQGCPPATALRAACCLHGLAAERLAVAGIGPVGLAAGELIDAARAIRNRMTTGAGNV